MQASLTVIFAFSVFTYVLMQFNLVHGAVIEYSTHMVRSSDVYHIPCNYLYLGGFTVNELGGVIKLLKFTIKDTDDF